MDPLTQAALGAAIGEAGFRRKLGPKAVAFGALCGLLPDADMALSLFDPWATLEYHRSVTHALLTLIITAPLIAWLGWRIWGRRLHYASWLHLSLWALVTHAVLDACTSYGTVLFWPISNRRIAFDAIAVIDPVYTLILLITLLVARVVPPRARAIALAGVVLSSAYLGLGALQSHRARALATHQFTSDLGAIHALRTTPTLLNIWLWRVLVRDVDGNLFVGHVSTIEPRTIRFIRVDSQDPLIKRARRTQQGRMFEWFAMGWVSADIRAYPEGVAVELSDQRYGLLTEPTRSPFRIRVLFDHNGSLIGATRVSGMPKTSMERELKALWRGIVGTASRP